MCFKVSRFFYETSTKSSTERQSPVRLNAVVFPRCVPVLSSGFGGRPKAKLMRFRDWLKVMRQDGHLHANAESRKKLKVLWREAKTAVVVVATIAHVNIDPSATMSKPS